MTVIAVKREGSSIVIACDSQISQGNNHIAPSDVCAVTKVVEADGFHFGGAGAMFESVMLEIFARNHKPKSATVDGIVDFLMEFQEWGAKRDLDFKSSNHYLFVMDGQIFQTYGGIVTEERSQYAAIGSGWQYATTALYMGKTASEAVQVAIDLTPWCCGPIREVVVTG